MALLLIRSSKQLVRSSSSWAAKPQLLRVCLTSLNNNNCFSTAAASSGGMTQQSNVKEIVDAAAFRYFTFSVAEYFAKNVANTMQNKPVPSSGDFHKFMDDLVGKLPFSDDETTDSASETDQAGKNHKATPEEIKATADFLDTVTGGVLQDLPKPEFKVKGDNFHFTLDTDGLYLTVNVSGLPKEDLVVWVVKDRILITSKKRVAPEQMVREKIALLNTHNYDPDEVTGTITEDGQLKISFPVSEAGSLPEEKYFEVDLV